MPVTLPSSRTRRVLAPIALALALAASAPAVALADPSAQERAAAQALFDDARRLMTAKKFAEACPKLEESQRIDPGIGTLLNLAECQTQIGKTASAWANFLDAAYQARATGQSKRENTARDRATKLEGKLSKINILAVTATGMEIKRDGAPVAHSLVGTSIPVDPGEHTVSVSAPGKKTWQVSVTVKPDGHLVTVSVPSLDDEVVKPPPPPEVKPPPPPPLEAKPPPPPEVKPPPQEKPPEVDPPPPPDPPGGGLRAGGVLLGILGLGGLGAATAFTVLAKQKNDASKSDTDLTLCDAKDVCGPAGKTLRNQAIGWGRAATIAVSAGGASLAAGVGLVIGGVVVQSRAARAVPAVSVTVEPGRGGTVILTGRF